MARWPISAWMHVTAAIYNWFGSYINWHHYLIDCDQIGSRIKGCTSSNWLQSTRIVDVDNRFDVRFDVWFDVQFDGWFDGWFDGQFEVQFNGRFDGRFDGQFEGQFNLTVLGYQPQQSIWQLRQEAKQPCCFTGSFYRLVVLRALNGYQPRGQERLSAKRAAMAIIIVT